MNSDLLQNWRATQAAALFMVARLNDEERWTHYHPDLSPLLWHLGHMAFLETYWIREVVLGDDSQTAGLHDFYFPERSPKPLRGPRLRDEADVAGRARTSFDDNHTQIAAAFARHPEHPLLQENYLVYFLMQHHCQHLETMTMVLQQRSLNEVFPAYEVGTPLAAKNPADDAKPFPGGTVAIGHPGGPDAYDNELPRHEVPLQPFALARRPVTNAEYLGFMEAGGYGDERWWSEQGRRWRAGCAARAPQHWRRDGQGRWFGVSARGPADLLAEAPVTGISRHEAEAYAAYAGGRLPHEYEWETAMNNDPGLAVTTGQAWEWCANAFHPYPGFRAFPYDGYSTPWFDGEHYVLKGASPATRASVRRSSFRNFYTPDKRHVFAGARLAWDG